MFAIGWIIPASFDQPAILQDKQRNHQVRHQVHGIDTKIYKLYAYIYAKMTNIMLCISIV